VQQLTLRYIGDPPGQIGAQHRGDIDAIDANLPCHGDEREHRAGERRFSRAVGTNDGRQRAGAEFGGHVADDGAAAESHADLVEDYAYHRRRSRIR